MQIYEINQYESKKNRINIIKVYFIGEKSIFIITFVVVFEYGLK